MQRHRHNVKILKSGGDEIPSVPPPCGDALGHVHAAKANQLIGSLAYVHCTVAYLVVTWGQPEPYRCRFAEKVGGAQSIKMPKIPSKFFKNPDFSSV